MKQFALRCIFRRDINYYQVHTFVYILLYYDCILFWFCVTLFYVFISINSMKSKDNASIDCDTDSLPFSIIWPGE